MMLTNLDIYFSAACNLNCSYCCMPQPPMKNEQIISAIRNQSFIKLVNANITKDMISLGLWGLEPTLNGKYFQQFIIPILKDNPQIKYLFLPTNLTVNILNTFIMPLDVFTFNNKRKLILQLQVSLDGPDYIQNKHMQLQKGYNFIHGNLRAIVQYMNQITNKYFRIKINNKSTLTAEDLYTNPDDWWYGMSYLQSELEEFENYSLKINLNNQPTLAVPGNYSKKDGKELVKWNLDFNTINYQTCAAGETSKTIDCFGNIFDCHMLINKPGIDKQQIYNDFNIKMDKLLQEGEIIETNKEALWNAISSIYCWATSNNSMPESYIKLLGNGALRGD